MNLLLISPWPEGYTLVGQGVVYTATLRQLRKIERLTVVAEEILVPNGTGESVKLNVRRPLSKWTTLGAMISWRPRAEERAFLDRLRDASSKVDAAIWFGSAYDPLTLRLPKRLKCPVWFHVNDSIALYETNCARGALRQMAARAYERRTLDAGYAGVIYVSADDFAAAMSLPARSKRCLLPIGVDVDVFVPGTARCPGSRVLYTGNMRYGPNVEGALFLIEKIVPLLDKTLEVIIAGADPAQIILDAAAKVENVTVTGRVPDMVSLYQNASVVVAPMFTGSGIKIKILEAMSCGVPVIASSLCRDAFPVPRPPILVADSPQEFRAAICKIVDDARLRAVVGGELRSYVLDRFSWSNRTAELMRLIVST